MDIAAIIFSLDPRVVPFPFWRTETSDARATDRPAKDAEAGLVVPLASAWRTPDPEGPGPGPSAA